MKKASTFRLIAIIIFTGLFISQTSCVVINKKKTGNHKGWFKNPNNPHHPNSTKPDKSNKNSNEKSKK